MATRSFYYFLLSFLFFQGISEYAQAQKESYYSKRKSSDIFIADKHFNLGEFYLAALEYGKIVQKDSSDAYALFQLAESYRQHFEYEKAEKIYQKVADRFKNEFIFARFWYATMLKDNSHYEKAIEHYRLFLGEVLDDDLERHLYRERAAMEIRQCQFALEIFKKEIYPYDVRCLPAPVNSEYGDFAPVIYENDTSLLITSSRTSIKGKIDRTLGGKFTDQYWVIKKKDTVWNENPQTLSLLNSSFNEVSGSLTADRKKYYFTRCDDKIRIENEYEEYNCGIYVSCFKNGTWGKPIRLNANINKENTWNSQPCISPDGKTLYFISKRPGGLGMHDIWYSTCNGDDIWGEPINLGDKINTIFMEMSPRYDEDQKVLFFSSNGHGGFGGLDIFMTRKVEGVYVKPINLGAPFSSFRDDLYFSLGQNKGYFNSNREGGLGGYDIYSFSVKNKDSLVKRLEGDTYSNVDLSEQIIGEIPAPIQLGPATLEGKLTDSITHIPLWGVKVKLKSLSSQWIAEDVTNEAGEYKIDYIQVNERLLIYVETKNLNKIKVESTPPTVVIERKP